MKRVNKRIFFLFFFQIAVFSFIFVSPSVRNLSPYLLFFTLASFAHCELPFSRRRRQQIYFNIREHHSVIFDEAQKNKRAALMKGKEIGKGGKGVGNCRWRWRRTLCKRKISNPLFCVVCIYTYIEFPFIR